MGRIGAAQTVTVTSTDPSPVTISLVTKTGTDRGDFLVSDETCSGERLAQNQTCQVDLRFAPSRPGTIGAALEIRSNATGSPDVVTLAGIGAVDCAGERATIIAGASDPQVVPGTSGEDVIAIVGGSPAVNAGGETTWFAAQRSRTPSTAGPALT